MNYVNDAQKSSVDKVAIIGIGNVLMGDDAVGPYAIKTINACYDLPYNVIALEVGTPAGELPGILAPFDLAIIIDAAQSTLPPGSIVRRDLCSLSGTVLEKKTIPHDPGLLGALRELEIMEEGPREVVLIGLVPKKLAMEIGLSPPVQVSMRILVGAVMAELARFGFVPDKEKTASEPDIWWER